MFDLETHFEHARILEYLKKEDMMSFETEFTIYTNIVPSISVRVVVNIREPRFMRESLLAGPDSLNFEQNSLEFQNKFHLTLNNPFNDVNPITSDAHVQNVFGAEVLFEYDRVQPTEQGR